MNKEQEKLLKERFGLICQNPCVEPEDDQSLHEAHNYFFYKKGCEHAMEIMSSGGYCND